MNITPIADYHGPLTAKFGLPRQSGLAGSLDGRIVFRPEYRNPDALRGLSGEDGFDRIWLIWGFSEVPESKAWQPTVRPPRLGGNVRMGVFATRSPFRPNRLGLSCVKILSVAPDGSEIRVAGADLMDGTPVYDIKPYVAYADAHPGARSGFVDEKQWEPLHVEIPDKLAVKVPAQHLEALKATLAQDPRPAFHEDPERTYGMPFLDMDVRFRVKDGVLTVVDCAGAPKVASRLVDDDTVEAQQ